MKSIFTLFTILLMNVGYSQNEIILKTEPIGFAFGLYQLAGEFVLNDDYSISAEFTSLDTSRGVLGKSWKGNAFFC